MSIFQIIGVAGFISYIASFAALQAKWIDGNGYLYAIGNIAGASLVLISLTEAFNLASALISVSWIVIGMAGIGWKLRCEFESGSVPSHSRHQYGIKSGHQQSGHQIVIQSKPGRAG